MIDGVAQNNSGGGITRIQGMRSFGLNEGARLASAGLSGGVGKAVDRAAHMAVGGAVSTAAAKAAAKYRLKRESKTPAESRVESRQLQQADREEKKIAGAGFWMVLGICIAKDLLDIFTNLSVILSILVWVTTMMILFVVNFYLFYNGVKPTTKKVLWQAVVFAGDSFPFISIFIGYTIYLIFVRIVENNELAGLSKSLGLGRVNKLLPAAK